MVQIHRPPRALLVASSERRRSNRFVVSTARLVWGVVVLWALITVMLHTLRRPSPAGSGGGDGPQLSADVKTNTNSKDKQKENENSIPQKNTMILKNQEKEEEIWAAARAALADLPLDPSVGQPCPYMKITDLTPDEQTPPAAQGPGGRHMVQPPADDVVYTTTATNSSSFVPLRPSLVCCHTTKGPWNIMVHPSWAPHGAQRFLHMVFAQYFNTQRVPLMRCVRNFLCQFGLAGPASKWFAATLPDDPNWLPAGPSFRMNPDKVKRFARGYLAYAGAGPHSRDNQFIVALQDNGPLGGGSPWEVPWGELVGNHSYQTLSNIYTGYGEEGPNQGLLWQEGALEKVAQRFPLLDYITSCRVVDVKD